jgi:hypothetical protein
VCDSDVDYDCVTLHLPQKPFCAQVRYVGDRCCSCVTAFSFASWHPLSIRPYKSILCAGPLRGRPVLCWQPSCTFSFVEGTHSLSLFKPLPAQVRYAGDRCCVCDSDVDYDCDQLVSCEGCGVTVHQSCYGVPELPDEDDMWLCRCGHIYWTAISGVLKTL